MTEYTVILERGPSNWSAYVPDLPGCVAAARTRKETATLITEAIRLHVQFLREESDEVPDPTTEAFRVSIPA